MQNAFQVAIGGGGPAGSAAAIILAKAGYRVLLADAAPTGAFRVGEGLPPAARSLLNELGVLPQFLADPHRTSFGNISVWGSAEPQFSDFLRQVQGNGFQLDRLRFDSMLRQAAQAAGVSVYLHTRIVLADKLTTPGPMRLHLKPTHAGKLTDHHNANLDISVDFFADFLIDATGRAASLARKLGAERVQFDQLLAFHTLLEAPRNHHRTDCDGRTLIEAVSNGWWYSVLLPSNQRLVAFLSDADLIDKSALLSCTGFHQTLMQTSFLSQLCREHAYQISRPPLGADASSGHLQPITGANWMAVGDAALTFDPLSSQGIANALYGGIAAARAVQAMAQTDTLIPPSLQHYTRHINAIFDRYLMHRHTFYTEEQRWPDQPFWQRRHAVSPNIDV